MEIKIESKEREAGIREEILRIHITILMSIKVLVRNE